MNEFADRYRQHPEAPQNPYAGQPPHYVVATPVAYPVAPGEGGVMYVNGVPQPLSRQTSRVLIGAIIFATCVVPLVIIAAVMFMMPDFDSMFSGAGTGVPSVPSITVPTR